VPTSMKQLDLSNNPGVLVGVDMPSWHHMEMLEEMKLAGCNVTASQFNELMLAVPASMKRLDLSGNPGILAGVGTGDMPSWHHLEMLQEIVLAGCNMKARQLAELMFAVPTSLKRINLSGNPGILAGVGMSDLPRWDHMEMLEEMALAGCNVKARQLDELMFALPTSLKRLDLSNNSGLLVGMVVSPPESGMYHMYQEPPCWHHMELLEEMKLIGCKLDVGDLDLLMHAIPSSVAVIMLDPSASSLDVLHHHGFSEDALLPGRWSRPVVNVQQPSDAAPGQPKCVIC